MRDVVIIGAGGHAQVVADILLRTRDAGEELNPIGYVDDNTDYKGKMLLGLPVVGTIADLSSIEHDAVVVGIGDNNTRRKVFDKLQQQGERFAVARHPDSVIAPDAQIGPGTMICAGVVVNTGSVVGSNVILNTACTIDHHNRIGDHSHIAPGVHLGGDVVIGEGTLVGIGAVVMPQRNVGEWSVVGAGTLVHKDVPDEATTKGSPAKIVQIPNKESR